jgi:hypothetical protein
VLAVICNQQTLTFSYAVPKGEANCLLFYKTPKPSEGQGSTLGLLTLDGGLVKSAYNSVARVFSGDAAQVSNGRTKLDFLLALFMFFRDQTFLRSLLIFSSP